MGENSAIEWTDHTWNPWRGCTKVSPACDNCYAEKLVTGRLGGHPDKRAALEKIPEDLIRIRELPKEFLAA